MSAEEVKRFKEIIAKKDRELKLAVKKLEEIKAKKYKELVELAAKKDKEIKKKDKIINEKDKKLAKMEFDLRKNKLASLEETFAASPSRSPNNREHVSADFLEKDFVCIDILPKIVTCSEFIRMFGEDPVTYGSEAQLSHYVSLILNIAFYQLGLNYSLAFLPEIGICNLRPDFWLVLYKRYPVGIVEVKKPHKDILSNANRALAGQTYDYLRCMKSFYGLKHCFGIVTTYKKWRIVWLNDDATNERALSHEYAPKIFNKALVKFANIKIPVISSVTNLNLLVDEPEDLNLLVDEPEDFVEIDEPLIDYDIEDSDEFPEESDDLKRELCVSASFSIENPENFAKNLFSVLIKMVCAEHEDVVIDKPGRPVAKITANSFGWCKLPPNFLLNSNFPTLQCGTFFLLRDLRGGLDGRVYFASSRNGSTCALKFSSALNFNDAYRNLIAEMNVWKAVGFSKVHIVTLNRKPCLVMPYAPSISAEKFTFKHQSEIVKFIELLADKGYIHSDIHFRHFALSSKGAILIDLAGAEQIKSPMTKKQAIKKMMDDVSRVLAEHVPDLQASEVEPEPPRKKTKKSKST